MNDIIRMTDLMTGEHIPAHVFANMVVQVLIRLILILWKKGILNDEDAKSLADTAQAAANWAMKNP